MSQPTAHSSKIAGVLIGGLLLLTLVMPFQAQHGGSQVEQRGPAITWSWQLLQDFSALPDHLRVLIIGAWSVGLLAFLLGALLWGVALSFGYLVLGIAAGTTIAFYARAETLELPPPPAVAGISGHTLLVLGGVILAAFLIVNGIRSRVGGRPGLRIAQLVVAVALAGLLGLATYAWITRLIALDFFAEGTPPGLQSAGVFDLIMDGLAGILAAAAVVIAFWHSFGFQQSEMAPARAANLLLLGALLLVLLRVLGTPAVVEQSAVVFVAGLAVAVMLVGLALVCLEAMVSIGSEIAARLGKPAN